MKTWTYACLVVGLLFFAVPAGASIPDSITITADTPWVTAGSKETSTITVEVLNGTSTPVPGAVVEFAVDGTDGTVSPVQAVTNGDGKAVTVFKPGTRSGTATITATVSHEGMSEPLTGSVNQQIDHAAPGAIANIWHERNVTAGGTTEIVVRMVDGYGNVVDNRKEAENVRFTASMIEGGTGAVFSNGADEITVPVDANGNATVMLRVDTVAGENLVYIRPASEVGSQQISINGVGGLPSRITQVVVPVSGSVPADGRTMVSFTCTLYDEYGNPTAEQGLWVNATMERVGQPDGWESRLITSNSHGQVMFTYGPEDSVGIATIVVTAATNESVSVSQEVEFTSTEPVNMLLSASPQSMPSRDVNDGSVSHLRAKVIDERGNPVEDERVEFEIVSVNCTPYVQTLEPELLKTWAYTDGNGSAIVDFRPGRFTIDRSEQGWSDTATGTAVVRATWENVTRDIILTWKNYPYLSVETEVSPETVAVDNTTDVTIRLRGDGWALQPDPIDVVLVIDRSGSMAEKDVRPSRMAAAKSAASTFIGQMDPATDRVGLVSFSSSTRVDNNLGDSFEEVTANLNALQANGATQLRRGIYEAIRMQKESSDRPRAIKAVVVMTDGDWNYDGSPLGHGTGYPESSDWVYSFSGNELEPDHYRYYGGLGGTLLEGEKWYKRNFLSGYFREYDYCIDGESTNQNMSRYASDNGVRLYMITFAYKPDKIVSETMEILSSSTGGFYEHARNGDELTDIYTRIAGELRTEAGVDTELDIAFENVEVNERFECGADVFDYVPMNGVSTTIESWVDNETGRHMIVPLHTIDQTADWNDDHNLHFNIGTVRLGQTWETTFSLRVTKEGNINVFGPGSTIRFNNGTDTLSLPDTFITAYPLNNTGMDFRELEISNLCFTGVEPVTEFLPVAWDLNYTGLYTVTEDLFYSNDNEYTWVKFDSISATNRTTGGESTLDVRGLPAGDYIIRVCGYAPDTGDASARLSQEVTVGANGSAYILVQ
ncbi:VWA domain-containing protein [Methanoculleus sp.]|uniref:VWA domain-containing protein n=1 Tax=Methanoculleus sp. TaxID=90427 RepID=UPI0025E09DCE|nr:VWA domain-containing protein [Methanoculleus sp.]